ncbi:PREDICTED: rubisco accumulation factor 1.1, chloroplastic-like [Lupinus angustifolius]|uniref:rubisco accumulation factor 1.1, chloroplastic-like n=1 Tax=Lupinus angustifolius TaxID=3871 RepID=UPI00092F21AB|nr:PREDICTED: rubisco accumulation factor 1.1, chloroplastic-like [Lupinus angustifolius]
MLSLSVNTLNLNPISPNHHHHHHHRTNSLKPISATLNFDRFSNNPPPIQQNLYQPFRPPPTPLPSKFSKLDLAARIDILANRLGQWYEYAPLIPALFREGFSPPSLEEATGITGVEIATKRLNRKIQVNNLIDNRTMRVGAISFEYMCQSSRDDDNIKE